MDSNGDTDLSISALLDKIMQDEEKKFKKRQNIPEKNKNSNKSNSSNTIKVENYTFDSQLATGNYQNCSMPRPCDPNFIPPTTIPPPPMNMGPTMGNIMPSNPPFSEGFNVPFNAGQNFHNISGNYSQSGHYPNYLQTPPPQLPENKQSMPFPTPTNPHKVIFNQNVNKFSNDENSQGENTSTSKKPKKKRSTSISSTEGMSIASPLPPPPSPPKLLMNSSFISQSRTSFQHTPPPPSSSNVPPECEKEKQLVYSHQRSITPPSVSYTSLSSDIPLPPSPLVGKPPEPIGTPPKSPLEDDYLSKDSRSSGSRKKSKKKSSSRRHKISKDENGNHDNRLETESIEKGCKSKSNTHENLHERHNQNSTPKNENVPFNSFSENPPFKQIVERPPFHPAGLRPFRPFGMRPFNSLRNRPPAFNHMGDRPFRPMNRGGPFPEIGMPFPPPSRGPPFNCIERGPPPFRPPFHPMREPPPFRPNFPSGVPPFNSMEGPPPRKPMVGGQPPFNSTEGGLQFNSKPDGSTVYPAEKDGASNHEWTLESGHPDVKKSKHKKYDPGKKTQHSDSKDKEKGESSKALKKVKRSKKDIKSKSKKKLRPDYELEPGECLSSDSDVDKNSRKSGNVGEDDSSGDSSSSSISSSSSSSTTTSSSSSSSISSLSSSSSDESFSSSSDDSLMNLDFLKSRKSNKGKVSRFDKFMEKIGSGDDNSYSEEIQNSSELTEKPKYPRYFKDKVAYSKDSPDLYNKDTTQLEVKSLKESPEAIKSKAETSIKKPSSPPISSESLKAIKTPLIKRLGLVEDVAMKENKENKEFLFEKKDNTDYSSDYPLESVDPTTQDDKDVLKGTKYFSSPNDYYEFHRQRSNSLSPNSSLDYEEFKLLASTKEILSASKSIFKSPNSPKATTTKKYEKPIIKVETETKPALSKQVKQSPRRIDLDSRLKIMFGLKGSSDENSPEKMSFKNAAFSYKNLKLLSRPPSPFRSKNAYQFWHRETYYFRKNNPVPNEFADPTAKRKIGIQIKELCENSDKICTSSGNSEQSNDSNLPKASDLINDKELKGVDNSSSNTDDSTQSEDSTTGRTVDKSEIPRSDLIKVNCDENKATKVLFQTDSEMEIVSEGLDGVNDNEQKLGNVDVTETGDNHVVNLILGKIIEELKNQIRDELTENLISEGVVANQNSETVDENQRDSIDNVVES